MRSFERQLITEWRKLELPLVDTVVVVAVSGGADSLSLLLSLNELRRLGKLELRMIAAHYNHNLRGSESDADETFVRTLCSERNIEFAAGHSTKNHASNIEQSARIERYDFLEKTAQGVRAFAVLTGHTVDDQAETFLLNLIRGSGTRGLSGMPSIRNIGDGTVKLIRPLLIWALRSDTEAYCHALGVKYRSDTMNEDESFTRVRIRKILIPLLKDFNSQIVDRLAETARLLGQEIGEEPDAGTEDLRLAELKALSESELNKLLRGWLAANRGDLRQIELKHIEAVHRLVHSRKSGKIVELPGGWLVVKEAGKLTVGKNKVEKRGSGA